MIPQSCRSVERAIVHRARRYSTLGLSLAVGRNLFQLA